MNNVQTITNKKVSFLKKYSFAIVYGLILTLMSYDFACANPIINGLNWAVDLLTNGLARGIAIIAFFAIGVMFFFGMLDFKRAGAIVLGIVFIFGGATIVDLISGSI